VVNQELVHLKSHSCGGRNPRFPVKTGIQFHLLYGSLLSQGRVWSPTGVYPDENRGGNDALKDLYAN
jgi:hypothetical protein